jgi:hypothetical protein
MAQTPHDGAERTAKARIDPDAVHGASDGAAGRATSCRTGLAAQRVLRYFTCSALGKSRARSRRPA